MWDTTSFNPSPPDAKMGPKRVKGTAVASHISRKTSEMWGTHEFVFETG
jgi:hypothetical protein